MTEGISTYVHAQKLRELSRELRIMLYNLACCFGLRSVSVKCTVVVRYVEYVVDVSLD